MTSHRGFALSWAAPLPHSRGGVSSAVSRRWGEAGGSRPAVAVAFTLGAQRLIELSVSCSLRCSLRCLSLAGGLPSPLPCLTPLLRAGTGVVRGPQTLGSPVWPLPVGGHGGGRSRGGVKGGRLGAAPVGTGAALPRVAQRKTAARTQVSSSSSRVPSRTLVTLATRPCNWPSGLGGGLGRSVGSSRTPSAGATGRESEPGTQGPALCES